MELTVPQAPVIVEGEVLAEDAREPFRIPVHERGRGPRGFGGAL